MGSRVQRVIVGVQPVALQPTRLERKLIGPKLQEKAPEMPLKPTIPTLAQTECRAIGMGSAVANTTSSGNVSDLRYSQFETLLLCPFLTQLPSLIPARARQNLQPQF